MKFQVQEEEKSDRMYFCLEASVYRAAHKYVGMD